MALNEMYKQLMDVLYGQRTTCIVRNMVDKVESIVPANDQSTLVPRGNASSCENITDMRDCTGDSKLIDIASLTGTRSSIHRPQHGE